MNTFLPCNNDSTFQQLKPALKNLGVWIKENWLELVALVIGFAIMEDLVDIADTSLVSASAELMTAKSEGFL